MTEFIDEIRVKDFLMSLSNEDDDDILKLKEYAKENNIYLSVCGELASIPAAALKFYEIGIRNLSVSPSMIRTLNSIYTDFINNK